MWPPGKRGIRNDPLAQSAMHVQDTQGWDYSGMGMPEIGEGEK